ncbi:helix-turn-helix domain-containing protein [Streptomyces boncukensis]|uniref:Helix-turn-helix domain-containing protein n=1 Tax=Streptomyces boncukensis TaxID=2711219 RepID=A0A6G4X3B9_9ACTN|nr:helix-turn-helix transcriptional regulator [Streptomyces boncukensis]NGO72029.1 helix-turn-helix domain-containing protein [Streptomyces boncukensis]
MPPRRQPTARQERLGAELRKMREAAGITGRDAAGLLGTNNIQVSQMEAGRAGVSEDRVRRMAAHYACDDADYIDALVAMATDRTKGWWEEYRGVLPSGFLDLSEMEHHATYRRDVALIHVPGLLQTEEYARAVFSYRHPPLPESELEPRVAHRMRRKTFIEEASSRKYAAVTHESALRIRVGDRAAARRQLIQLLELSAEDQVSLRVIPFDRDDFGGAGWAMGYMGTPVPQLDTVTRDTPYGTHFLDAESQLQRSRVLFHRMEGESLTLTQSRDFIHQIAKEL